MSPSLPNLRDRLRQIFAVNPRDLLRALRLVPLLFFFCACQHHPNTYRVIVAARNLPSGTVIQPADAKIIEASIADADDGAFENGGLTNDLTRVIGHTTKVDIPEGYTININQIEP